VTPDGPTRPVSLSKPQTAPGFLGKPAGARETVSLQKPPALPTTPSQPGLPAPLPAPAPTPTPRRSKGLLIAAGVVALGLLTGGIGTVLLSGGTRSTTSVAVAPTVTPAPIEPSGEAVTPFDPPDAAPTDAPDLVVHDDTGEAPTVAALFQAYVDGINQKAYAEAFAVLSARAQKRGTFASFAKGLASTKITRFSVVRIGTDADGSQIVEVMFTSEQDAVAGGTGQTCSNWAIGYTLVAGLGGLQIDRAVPHEGSPAAC
jgi:hypothetical protein